ECLNAPARVVVEVPGFVHLPGAPQETLSWTPQRLAMRYDYLALMPCWRRSGMCEHEALTLTLSTPSENVVEIRHERVIATRHGDRRGGWAGLGVGTLAAMLGVALAAHGAWRHDRVSAAEVATGGVFVAFGAFFGGTGLHTLLARDSHERVYEGGAY